MRCACLLHVCVFTRAQIRALALTVRACVHACVRSHVYCAFVRARVYVRMAHVSAYCVFLQAWDLFTEAGSSANTLRYE